MHVYLPIAQISIDAFVLLGLGLAVGFLSGMFGIGGGFLITPMLIFLGVPSDVATATGANQVVGTSVAGALAQWRRDNVDLKMGFVLIAGGVVGAAVGVQVVSWLRQQGQAELFIALSYVFVLGAVGLLMLNESIRALRQARDGKFRPARRAGQHSWILKLPFKQRFRHSKLYVSLIPPIAIGFFVGILSAVMGVGGGFIMVPAMIYLLRMPTKLVIGTSVFQIAFVTAIATILHATQNKTVDVMLAMLLMSGGVIGAEFGARTGQKLAGEQLRALLAILVLAVSARLAYELMVPPRELFSVRGASW